MIPSLAEAGHRVVVPDQVGFEIGPRASGL